MGMEHRRGTDSTHSGRHIAVRGHHIGLAHTHTRAQWHSQGAEGTVGRAPATGLVAGSFGFVFGQVGRMAFLENHHPGRLVNKFAILVIDFVTALFNLGVKKTAGLMIKYPRIEKNARQFFDPVPPRSECLK